ncbi:DUF3189 family protein [Caminicella sporogenes]|uniref:DUF3189 family protein n=1 Tax=Caminicella sporogenes TaxID=166485 RepID=UPI0025410305|nr:DUF3189 family protein [Caminicella sporogenes]WIF95957.1 DUF3189 family protein [Caminicella sporogenes]
MNIIYHDVGGTHSAVIATYIHLNKLPKDKVPTIQEILNVPMFDKLKSKQIGRLILHGIDEFGNRVYTLSRLYHGHSVTNAIRSIPTMAGIDENEILLVDTSPTVNLLMKIGGGSSRRFGMIFFGRPLVAYGTMKTYKNILNLVNKVKIKIAPN